MLNYYSHVVLGTFFSLLLLSCTSLKTCVDNPVDLSQKTKVCVLGTEIIPYGRPRKIKMSPLDHEAMFDKKVNKNASRLMVAEESRLDSHYKILCNTLAQKYNVEVLNDEVISAQLSANELIELNKASELILPDNYFKKVLCSQKGIHPVMYNSEALHTKKKFEFSSYCAEIQKISDNVDADLFLLSIIEPHNRGVGAFGIAAEIHLEMHLLLYDKTGKLVSHLRAQTKGQNVDGKDIDDFMSIIDDYPFLLDKLLMANQKLDAK